VSGREFRENVMCDKPVRKSRCATPQQLVIFFGGLNAASSYITCYSVLLIKDLLPVEKRSANPSQH